MIEGDAGEGTISFDITLSEPAPVGGASVDFSTTDGTATSPGDFDALTDFTVEFAEGETQKTVSLAVFGDTDFEPDETFTATLSNPTGTGAVIGDGEATGTILNDDAPPPQAPARPLQGALARSHVRPRAPRDAAKPEAPPAPSRSGPAACERSPHRRAATGPAAASSTDRPVRRPPAGKGSPGSYCPDHGPGRVNGPLTSHSPPARTLSATVPETGTDQSSRT